MSWVNSVLRQFLPHGSTAQDAPAHIASKKVNSLQACGLKAPDRRAHWVTAMWIFDHPRLRGHGGGYPMGSSWSSRWCPGCLQAFWFLWTGLKASPGQPELPELPGGYPPAPVFHSRLSLASQSHPQGDFKEMLCGQGESGTGDPRGLTPLVTYGVHFLRTDAGHSTRM